MTNIKGSNNIDRVTREPVHQIDEANRPNRTHATGVLPFNEIGPNITLEALSDLLRAGFVLPSMPPDFEYLFVANFIQSYRSLRQ